MTKYWICVRQVQGDDFTDKPDLGTTRYLRVPDEDVPKPAHQIPVKQWTKEILALFPSSPSGPTGDIGKYPEHETALANNGAVVAE
jgi:hypothetical protein